MTVLVATLVLGGVLAVRTLWPVVQPEQCTAQGPGGEVTLTPEQMANAAVVAAVGQRRGLSERAVQIALATALQESKLRNLRFGDRDSLGLFQQRPSQGWGTEEQILDPVYASTAFYTALVKVKGWETMPLTEAAQAVQRSGHPSLYAQHEQRAASLAASLVGSTPAGLSCRLPTADSAGQPGAAVSALATQLGVTGAVSPSTGSAGEPSVTVPAASTAQGWAIGAWAVAQAEGLDVVAVQVADRQWRRDTGRWEPVPTDSTRPGQVSITLARG